ncbi:MAG: E3 binding domain-containing protein, partial [Pseudomonadota bacterium]|nr:E3 binding domain-containing protein [Pseudomonadota bacterium]
MAGEIVVPSLGESVTEATVAKWFKQVGDAVAQDEAVCELETDKVTLEVGAPVAGRLANIVVPEGKAVEVGAVLGAIEAGAAGAKAAPQKSDVGKQMSEEKKSASSPTSGLRPPASAPPQAGPAARKLLEESGIPTSSIQGSGKDGRVTKGDVLEASGGQRPAASQKTSSPAADNRPLPT